MQWILDDPFLQGVLLHCILLVATCWLTYWDILRGQFVSDDWDGVANYDGTFKRISPPAHIPTTTSIPTVQTGNISGGSRWNDVLTWIRWQIGKAPNVNYNKPLDAAKPDGPRDQRQYLPSPLRHHRLNLFLFSGISIGIYSILAIIVNEPTAFLATLLWIVHPVGIQAVGWISGIGYVLATFFMVMGLNYAITFSATPLMQTPWAGAILAGYGVLQFLAFRSQFTSIAVVAILCYLHLWPFAVVAALVAAVGLYRTFAEVVSVRAKTFRQQQMGASTYLHPKKLVVVGKTIYYYTKLMLFPKRLGLYHTYGYHYPMPWIEWEDRYFWAGAGIAMAALAGAVWCPPPVSFAVLWIASFTVFVLNWITVHQFVAERYLWLPVVGVCLLVATYAPPWLFWLLAGLALMRTWAHLPTYFNELMFYQSNVWNHPNSEVALGNLGVTFLRLQLPGSAVDHWQVGTRVNPDYDVNWYNLYSIYRSQGMFDQARQFLLRALSCTTCHFPKEWRVELNTLDLEISWQRAMAEIPVKDRLVWQKANLERMLVDPALPHPDYWKAKMKWVDEQLIKHPPAPPALSATPPTVAPAAASS